MLKKQHFNLPVGRLSEPERVSEGFLLTDQDNSSKAQYITSIISLLFACIPIMMFVAFLLIFLADPQASTFFMVLFASFFVIVFGIILVIPSIRSLLVIYRLEAGQVVLKSYPLRMGEVSRVQYQRRLLRGNTSQTGIITAKWICYEWVKYRRGTSTEIQIHPLWEKELPDISIERGTRIIEYQTEVLASSQYPPSFDAEHNQIRWELRVTLDVPGLAKDTSYFMFRVMPEVIG